MHGAHVLQPANGIGVEATVVEEPLHVGHHVVQLAGECGHTVLLYFYRLEVFNQLQCSDYRKRKKKVNLEHLKILPVSQTKLV